MREFPGVPTREQYESAESAMQAAQEEFDATRDLKKLYELPFPGPEVTSEQANENGRVVIEAIKRQKAAEQRLASLQSGGPMLRAKKTNPEVMQMVTMEEAQKIQNELHELQMQFGPESSEVRTFIESLNEHPSQE